MQHIVQIAFDFDDDKIRRSIESNIEKEIINNTQEKIHKEFFAKRWGEDKPIENMVFNSVTELIKSHKEEIIDMAAKSMCDRMVRRKGVKEQILGIAEEDKEEKEMATKQEVATQGKQQVPTKVGITGYLSNDRVREQIVNVVGEKNATRFISSVVSAVQTNKTLQACTNQSIFSAALLGESLQLTPSPQLGQYYMVPYENTKLRINEAQFQIGYKGYIQLAIRSGQYRKIVVSDVRQGEVGFYNPITEEFGMNPVLDMKKRQELPVVGYYGMFELTNGFRKELYWPKEQMEEHAKTYFLYFLDKEFRCNGEENTYPPAYQQMGNYEC